MVEHWLSTPRALWVGYPGSGNPKIGGNVSEPKVFTFCFFHSISSQKSLWTQSHVFFTLISVRQTLKKAFPCLQISAQNSHSHIPLLARLLPSVVSHPLCPVTTLSEGSWPAPVTDILKPLIPASPPSQALEATVPLRKSLSSSCLRRPSGQWLRQIKAKKGLFWAHGFVQLTAFELELLLLSIMMGAYCRSKAAHFTSQQLRGGERGCGVK